MIIEDKIDFFPHSLEKYPEKMLNKLKKLEEEYFQVICIKQLGDSNKNLTLFEIMAIKGASHRLQEIFGQVKSTNLSPIFFPPKVKPIINDPKVIKCTVDPIAFKEDNNPIVIARFKVGKQIKNKKSYIFEVLVDEPMISGKVQIIQKESKGSGFFNLSICKELLNKKLEEYDWIFIGDLN